MPIVTDPPGGTGVVASVVIKKVRSVVKEGLRFKGAKPVFWIVKKRSTEDVP